MLSNANIKEKAKSFLQENLKSILLLFLPILILNLLSGGFSFHTNYSHYQDVANHSDGMGSLFTYISTILILILEIAILIPLGKAYFKDDKSELNLTSSFKYLVELIAPILGYTFLFYGISIAVVLVIGITVGLLFFTMPVLAMPIIIAAIIALVWFGIRIGFTPYILVDSRYNLSGLYSTELGVIDSMKESWRISKGHVFDYILFNLSFLGWYILSIFTLGLGLIYTIPYINIATLEFYKEMVEKK